MKAKLFQRTLAMLLCLAMSVTMLPLSAFAATPPKQANVIFHMAYLDNGQLVSASYDDESKGAEYKYDRLMYIRFTWPVNTQQLKVTIDGPVSGTLMGFTYRRHVVPTGSFPNIIYKKGNMTETAILEELALISPSSYVPLLQTYGISKDGKTNGSKAPSTGGGGNIAGGTGQS